MSELLDHLVETARQQGSGEARSVAGAIHIDNADPTLEHADDALLALFEFSGKPAKK